MSQDTRHSDTEAATDHQSEWEVLRLISQPTRAALLSDILGHPQELPSVREFDYFNPDVKRSNIEYHLNKLVEANIVEKQSLPPGERKRDLPSTFYGLTDEGWSILEKHGLTDEQPVWKAVNERVEKPPEIQEIEQMKRPSTA
ncbi:winged helix-turn-helix domain-containing protein [Natronorarus salvus]|uniref:winged helix-turn-helix domain-containing protein n=1 Tax=Natronorarus salvus TaxID=3117733 RepID=UPI002F26C08F